MEALYQTMAGVYRQALTILLDRRVGCKGELDQMLTFHLKKTTASLSTHYHTSNMAMALLSNNQTYKPKCRPPTMPCNAMNAGRHFPSGIFSTRTRRNTIHPFHAHTATKRSGTERTSTDTSKPSIRRVSKILRRCTVPTRTASSHKNGVRGLRERTTCKDIFVRDMEVEFGSGVKRVV
ncbi:hypothetical protein BCR34DRAFT_566930 [Clohesyomyces aquaticus]|uniref:Uncharacterized protein n=1 Tax=Clohesyomyces aquaticus TaxID=1231657 RepID=A0A1Y1ZJK4_9PLEO|nr:hypothetical protein BCR34DRAFT_566930 [Clohesyomyces aquaticus]